jgi:tetratricopeptide (TPR) repeat protein
MDGIDTGRELDAFVAADATVERALSVLSGAASLTDDLAQELLAILDTPATRATQLIEALHACDFIVERNSEWHLAPRAREPLREMLRADSARSKRVHARLFELAGSAGDSYTGELPTYLTEGPGAAYHGAFLSHEEALSAYAAFANAPLTGQQWLASRLVSEQTELGVLPGDALEVLFLRGMVMYREGRRYEATPLLRKVATANKRTRDVAIAAHLVGRLDARRFRWRKRGERLLRRSLDLLEDLGDVAGVAQVLHTLGQAVSRDRKRSAEAEDLLRRSLELEEDLGDKAGVAQVLHTLGQTLSRDRDRSAEAEDLLRRSLELREGVGDLASVAQVLHTLGQALSRDRDRSAEAEDLLRRSLELEENLGNDAGVAQVLHTLGQAVNRDPERSEEAQRILERSLELGETLGNANHQAQVLYSMARVAGVQPETAEELLRRSLILNRQIGNRSGERIVLAELRRRGMHS